MEYVCNGILLSKKEKWTTDIWSNMEKSKIIMPSEWRQMQKSTSCVCPCIWNSRVGGTILPGVGCGIDNRRIERNFSDSGNVLASDCDGIFMTLYSCQNILKIGDFIVSEFQSWKNCGMQLKLLEETYSIKCLY